MRAGLSSRQFAASLLQPRQSPYRSGLTVAVPHCQQWVCPINNNCGKSGLGAIAGLPLCADRGIMPLRLAERMRAWRLSSVSGRSARHMVPCTLGVHNMKRILATTLATALATSSTVVQAQTPPVVSAQGPTCTAICQAALDQKEFVEDLLCAVPFDPQAPRPVAMLSEVEGQIVRTAARGFTPVAKQAGLSVGEQVLLANESGALLTSGPSCQVQLTGPAVLNATAVNACGCISQEQVRVFAAEPLGPMPPLPEPAFVPEPRVFPWWIPLGAAAGIGGLILLLDDDDDRPRPRPRGTPVSP
jgi:hypothetical protein